LMYVLSTGCQWRAIPKDLPPRSTVYDYFDLWCEFRFNPARDSDLMSAAVPI